MVCLLDQVDFSWSQFSIQSERRKGVSSIFHYFELSMKLVLYCTLIRFAFFTGYSNLSETLQQILNDGFSASNGARTSRLDVGKFLVVVTDRDTDDDIATATNNVI